MPIATDLIDFHGLSWFGMQAASPASSHASFGLGTSGSIMNAILTRQTKPTLPGLKTATAR